MKIIKLEAQNIKRLKAVAIEPGGKAVVIIGGRNGAGKTSVLDAIEMALGGSKSVPPKPIREGASKARIVLDTGEIVVTRTFTAKGSQLIVTGKDGLSVGSPQTLLDKLCSHLSFDPLEFARMKPADQAATLRQVTGLDLSALDQERARCYEERTLLNREVKQLDAQVEAIPEQDVPALEATVPELVAELERRHRTNAANAEQCRALEQNRRAHQQANTEVVRLRKALAETEQAAKMLLAVVSEQAKLVAGLADADVEEIQGRIAQADAVGIMARQQEERRALALRRDEAAAAAEKLTRGMAEIDEKKELLLARTKMPVRGLAFGETGVTFNGLPFEQCCDSEKLKISLAMGLALNPALKVVLVRDGSLLDGDSLRLVAEMATAAEAQVWVERVSTGKEVSVIIEDGMVAARGDDGE